LHALTRAVTGDRVRYLLADEVGLGKTIEAGLIFRELKLRGLVKRVLVVAPKELVTQWVQEMQTHFGEGRMMKRMTRRMTTRTRRMRGSRTPRSVSFDLSMHGPETARTLLPTWASGVAVDTFTKRSTT
jgi:N12 class adenine-specific DNA methylase